MNIAIGNFGKTQRRVADYLVQHVAKQWFNSSHWQPLINTSQFTSASRRIRQKLPDSCEPPPSAAPTVRQLFVGMGQIAGAASTWRLICAARSRRLASIAGTKGSPPPANNALVSQRPLDDSLLPPPPLAPRPPSTGHPGGKRPIGTSETHWTHAAPGSSVSKQRWLLSAEALETSKGFHWPSLGRERLLAPNEHRALKHSSLPVVNWTI